MLCLVDGRRLTVRGRLTGQEGVLHDGMRTFHHELEHEMAHLSTLAVFCGVIIENGHVLGALQETMEVVGVDGHLVLDGGEFVGMAYAVGNEGTVINAFGHIAFVAGENENVVEIQVAGLQYAHDLNSLCRLAVEGDGSLLDELVDKTLQGCRIDLQVAVVNEAVNSVDQGVGSEYRLLE